MKKKGITIVSHPQFLDHDTGFNDHPEIPERLMVIDKRLREGVFSEQLHFVRPEPVKRNWLKTYHTEAWLLRFEEEVLCGRSFINHPDNQVCYESYQVAVLSAGSGITGVDLVESGQQKTVFCATRPPGHHAEAETPYGFCFLNNCVIAARYWQQKYGRKRICVIDFDAHHGNGIQAALEYEDETLYISIHEHPSFSFPGTGLEEDDGIGRGAGTVVNIPLEPWTKDMKVLSLFDACVAERIEQFRPEAIIVAAGFDGHREDDMSDLHYSTALFAKIGEYIGTWAQKYCQGRVVSILEGGYCLPVLGESVEAYLAGLHSRINSDMV